MSLKNCLVSGTSFIHNYITQAFRSWQTLTGSLSHILAESQQEFYLTSSDTVPLCIRKKNKKTLHLAQIKSKHETNVEFTCLFVLSGSFIGHDCAGHGYENPLAQNSFNTAEEQSMQRQQSISLLEFVQCLGVSSESLYNLIELNMGQQSVIDWSNPQTLYILHKVLQEIKSVKQCLQLMDWVQHKYLRYLCASLLFFV